MCLSRLAGLPACPHRWPGQSVHWCSHCRFEYERRWKELFAAFDPPCPLSAHQVEAYEDWLASGDRPAWSLGQLARPSAN